MVLNRMRFQLFLIIIVFMTFFYWISPVLAQQNKVVIIPLIEGCDGIKTVTSAGGRVWMDRNLGALRVAQSEDDYHAYGWLYQWGRLADGHEDRGSEKRTNLSFGNVPGHDDFITAPATPYDWMNEQNNNLWQGASGDNNPCPEGFRIPTETEWEAERTSWSSNTTAGAFESPLKLTVAGFRSNNDGTLWYSGTRGYYWSSTINPSIYVRAFILTSSSAGLTGSYRAYGYSVRCIQD